MIPDGEIGEIRVLERFSFVELDSEQAEAGARAPRRDQARGQADPGGVREGLTRPIAGGQNGLESGERARRPRSLLVRARARPRADAAEVVSATEVRPRLEELTIRTGALGAATHVRVLLPAAYDALPDHRWPVVYLLHAAMGDHTSWSKALDTTRVRDGHLPAIVVMPDGGDSGFYTDWWNGGAGGPPAWESYHVGELLPLIDARYRTRAARGGRILMGASMGGFGAFSYAARHPDLFGAAISISGALDTNYPSPRRSSPAAPCSTLQPADSVFGPRASQEIRWRAHNPWDLAANLRPLDLQIRTHNGQPGPGYLGFDGIEYAIHEMSESLHSRLDELSITHLWRDYGPGNHTSFATAAPRHRLARHDRPVAAQISSLPPVPKSFDHVAADARVLGLGMERSRPIPQRALEFLRVARRRPQGRDARGLGDGDGDDGAAVPASTGRSTSQRRESTTPREDEQGRADQVRGRPRRPAPDQQYTPAAAAAGQGKPGYFTTRTVTFKPRQRRHRHHPPRAARPSLIIARQSRERKRIPRTMNAIATENAVTATCWPTE